MMVVDSSVLIAFLRGRKAAARFLRGHGGSGPLVVPAIAAYELWRGARSRHETESVRKLLDAVTVDPFTPALARLAGDLDVDQRRRGTQRPSIDLLIAAHAIHRNCPLGTVDRDYSGITGLDVVEAPKGP